jgi:hypothetical protein
MAGRSVTTPRRAGTRSAALACSIDEDGQVVDAYISERRNAAAARAFFERAMADAAVTPERVTTGGPLTRPSARRRSGPRRRCGRAEPRPYPGGPLVGVVEAPEYGPCGHRTGSGGRARGGPGRLEAQGPMRPLRVVEVDVLGEDGAEVPLVQRDQVVQARSAHGVWFTDIVTPGCSATSCPPRRLPHLGGVLAETRCGRTAAGADVPEQHTWCRSRAPRSRWRGDSGSARARSPCRGPSPSLGSRGRRRRPGHG